MISLPLAVSSLLIFVPSSAHGHNPLYSTGAKAVDCEFREFSVPIQGLRKTRCWGLRREHAVVRSSTAI